MIINFCFNLTFINKNYLNNSSNNYDLSIYFGYGNYFIFLNLGLFYTNLYLKIKNLPILFIKTRHIIIKLSISLLIT